MILFLKICRLIVMHYMSDLDYFYFSNYRYCVPSYILGSKINKIPFIRNIKNNIYAIASVGIICLYVYTYNIVHYISITCER